MVRTESRDKPAAFGEGKIFGGFLGGTALCLWTFTVVLPALGFGVFAREFEGLADKAAPCLLSPVVAWLVVRLRRYGMLPFVLGLVGGVVFLFSFFVIYNVPLMLVGVVILGGAVGVAYRAYRQQVDRGVVAQGARQASPD